MYHVELRQFPHNFCRFNLTESELRAAVLDAWAKGEWIELGERKWNPQQAKLTVLEGPHLPVAQLSMGRGWRNAKREGRDVTDQLLPGARSTAGASASTYWRRVVSPGASDPSVQSSATEPTAASGVASSVDAEPDPSLAGDSLGLEMLARLGAEPVPLIIVWRCARERYPELRASDCLKLAELAVRSLVGAGLAVVLVADGSGEYEPCGADDQIEQALRSIDSWSSTGGFPPVQIGKA